MDVDAEEKKESEDQEGEEAPPVEEDKETTQGDVQPPKVVVTKDDKKTDKGVDLDALYPMFWGLQAYFSAPTKCFDPQHFATFKSGLESTLAAFKDVNTDLEAQSNSKVAEELRKSTKRKRSTDGTEVASSFNPKYLTSRDLFDLEVCTARPSVFGCLTNACRSTTLPSGDMSLSKR